MQFFWKTNGLRKKSDKPNSSERSLASPGAPKGAWHHLELRKESGFTSSSERSPGITSSSARSSAPHRFTRSAALAKESTLSTPPMGPKTKLDQLLRDLFEGPTRPSTGTRPPGVAASAPSRTPPTSWMHKAHSPCTPAAQYVRAPTPDSSALTQVQRALFANPGPSQPTQAPWRLVRIDLPPANLTRPPLHHLHPWDRRAKRALSPRYQERPDTPNTRLTQTTHLNSKERRRERRKLLFGTQ